MYRYNETVTKSKTLLHAIAQARRSRASSEGEADQNPPAQPKPLPPLF